jgi:hypothetical protein
VREAVGANGYSLGVLVIFWSRRSDRTGEEHALAILQALRAGGVDVLALGPADEVPILHAVVMADAPAVVRWLVTVAGAPLEERDDDGDTPLMAACCRQAWAAALALLAAGARVDSMCAIDGSAQTIAQWARSSPDCKHRGVQLAIAARAREHAAQAGKAEGGAAGFVACSMSEGTRRAGLPTEPASLDTGGEKGAIIEAVAADNAGAGATATAASAPAAGAGRNQAKARKGKGRQGAAGNRTKASSPDAGSDWPGHEPSPSCGSGDTAVVLAAAAAAAAASDACEQPRAAIAASTLCDPETPTPFRRLPTGLRRPPQPSLSRRLRPRVGWRPRRSVPLRPPLHRSPAAQLPQPLVALLAWRQLQPASACASQETARHAPTPQIAVGPETCNCRRWLPQPQLDRSRLNLATLPTALPSLQPCGSQPCRLRVPAQRLCGGTWRP